MSFCGSITHFFKAEYYSVVWVDHSVCIYLIHPLKDILVEFQMMSYEYFLTSLAGGKKEINKAGTARGWQYSVVVVVVV